MNARRPMLDVCLVAAALAVNTAGLAAVASLSSAPDGDRVAGHRRDAGIARTVCISCGVVQSVRLDPGEPAWVAAQPRARHQVRVRLDNGTIRVLYPRDAPPVAAGDRVRIVDERLEIEG